MKILQALCVPGLSSFYFDDQKAIKQGAQLNGCFYHGPPKTNGFSAIRQAGECITIVLILDDGQVALGDCAAVQYSGAAGRDPVFLAETFIPFLRSHIVPKLVGLDVTCFRHNVDYFDNLNIEGQRLHTAIRYGLSQALINACALSHHKTPTEIICEEYDLPIILDPLKLFGQSGEDIYNGADKMIIKRIDALPHGLINTIDDKLGHDGQILENYVNWLQSRLISVRKDEYYHPDIHLDVYGTVGEIFNNKPIRIADYLARLGDLAAPFSLYIEGPVDAGEQNAQIDSLGQIKQALKGFGSSVKIVADEWCNTYEDIVKFVDANCCDMVQIKTPDLGGLQNTIKANLYCQENNVEAYQGGTCNETEISTKACVHIAMATRPERLLVKPGMGFDEGMMIVSNEMQRTLAIMKARQN